MKVLFEVLGQVKTFILYSKINQKYSLFILYPLKGAFNFWLIIIKNKFINLGCVCVGLLSSFFPNVSIKQY